MAASFACLRGGLLDVLTSDELLRLRWGEAVFRDANQAPLVSVEFAAAQGPCVVFADIRDRSTAGGVLGFIPGSSFPGIPKLRALARDGQLHVAASTCLRSAARSRSTSASSSGRLRLRRS